MMVEAVAPGLLRKDYSSPESSAWFGITAKAHPQTATQLLSGMQLEVISTPQTAVLDPRLRRIIRQEKLARKDRPGYHNPVKMQLTPAPLQDPQNPNMLTLVAKPAQYIRSLALIGRDDVDPTIQQEVNHGGISMMWVTTDGKIVFEERSQHSQINPGAGGPIGGGLDGVLKRSEDGSPILANAKPEAIIQHGMTETYEELGMSREEQEDILHTPGGIRIAGMIQDRKRGHFDIVCVGKSRQTAFEMQQRYLEHKNNGHDLLHDPMPKKLLFIAATPETIARLLTQSDATLAPATQGAFALTGYMLMLDRVFAATGDIAIANTQADAWMEETRQLTAKNNDRKEYLARSYHHQQRRIALWQEFAHISVMENSNERNQALAALRKRVEQMQQEDISGFDPLKKLSDQGLPDLEQSLKDAGIWVDAVRGSIHSAI